MLYPTAPKEQSQSLGLQSRAESCARARVGSVMNAAEVGLSLWFRSSLVPAGHVPNSHLDPH